MFGKRDDFESKCKDITGKKEVKKFFEAQVSGNIKDFMFVISFNLQKSMRQALVLIIPDSSED